MRWCCEIVELAAFSSPNEASDRQQRERERKRQDDE
jgi:hypothetical protein